MRLFFKLILGLIMLSPVALATVAWFALEAQPIVTPSRALDHTDIARARQVIKENDPRRLPAGIQRTVRISERDLNRVVTTPLQGMLYILTFGIGSILGMALPFMDADWLTQVMQDDGVVEQPQWLVECRETTCLTRIDSPLLQQLRTRYGNGLLTRLAARLTELAQLAGNLLPDRMAMDEGASVYAKNPGIGWTTAARGQLLHRVCLERECIASYQILASTEWNFHPQGVAARSLATLHGETKQITRQAKLLINTIDPCVGYELSIG